jgi:hypothetical protein
LIYIFTFIDLIELSEGYGSPHIRLILSFYCLRVLCLMIVDAEISIPGVASTLFLSHSDLLSLFLHLLLGSLSSACLVLLRFPLATLGPLRRLVECAVEVVLEVVRSSVGLPFRVPSL